MLTCHNVYVVFFSSCLQLNQCVHAHVSPDQQMPQCRFVARSNVCFSYLDFTEIEIFSCLPVTGLPWSVFDCSDSYIKVNVKKKLIQNTVFSHHYSKIFSYHSFSVLMLLMLSC